MIRKKAVPAVISIREIYKILSEKTIDTQFLVVYDADNTEKEVIQKFMIQDYSEVAEA